MTALFEIDNVRVLRRGRLLLDIEHLCLPAHRHTAIIGPNGAGKSTLLRALLGLGGGSVRFLGAPVQQAAAAARLAWVGQHGHYNLPLSVRDYVLLGRYPQRGGLAPSLLADLLAAFDLTHLAARRIGSLSGGEQQRANLVRALVQQAPALLLDEPCNHLDIRHQCGLMQYLHQQRQTSSAVMVLHDLNLAACHADHVVVLDQGRVAATGAPAQVMTEALLSRVYQWPIHRVDEAGGIYFRMAEVA